jgi:hypothetical protein
MNKDRICYNIKTNHTKVVGVEQSNKELGKQALQEFRLTLSPEELEQFDKIVARTETSLIMSSFTLLNPSNSNLMKRYMKFHQEYMKSHKK